MHGFYFEIENIFNLDLNQAHKLKNPTQYTDIYN